jgi:hypothetical protein
MGHALRKWETKEKENGEHAWSANHPLRTLLAFQAWGARNDMVGDKVKGNEKDGWLADHPILGFANFALFLPLSRIL